MFSFVKIVVISVVCVSTFEILIVVILFSFCSHTHFFCNVISAVDHCIHILWKVCTLAAASSDGDHCSIGKAFCICHQIICIGIYSRLRQRPVLCTHGDSRTVAAVIGVQLGQFFVCLVSCILQRLKDSHCGRTVRGTGSHATEKRVGGIPAEYIQCFYIIRKGKQSVVLYQYKTFFTHLFDGVFALLFGVFI